MQVAQTAHQIEKHWKHFPQGADVSVRGIGTTREDAFEQAALALTAEITALHLAAPKEEIKDSCAGPDDELLLVD